MCKSVIIPWDGPFWLVWSIYLWMKLTSLPALNIHYQFYPLNSTNSIKKSCITIIHFFFILNELWFKNPKQTPNWTEFCQIKYADWLWWWCACSFLYLRSLAPHITFVHTQTQYTHHNKYLLNLYFYLVRIFIWVLALTAQNKMVKY